MARTRTSGPNPGAGRKRGSGVVRTRAAALELLRREETPLHVMVEGMLELWHAAQAEAAGPARLDLVRQAIGAAAQAAPYMHARLTSVSATVRTIGSLSDLSDDELASLAASMGAAVRLVEGECEAGPISDPPPPTPKNGKLMGPLLVPSAPLSFQKPVSG